MKRRRRLTKRQRKALHGVGPSGERVVEPGVRVLGEGFISEADMAAVRERLDPMMEGGFDEALAALEESGFLAPVRE